MVLGAWGVFVLGLAILVATWNYHPEEGEDLEVVQQREIEEKVIALDQFLARVQAQRDPLVPELVVELGVQVPPSRRVA
jgi:hypothetical protein